MAGTRDLLIEQRYLPADPEDFILGILPHFRDSRYIRVKDRRSNATWVSILGVSRAVNPGFHANGT